MPPQRGARCGRSLQVRGEFNFDDDDVGRLLKAQGLEADSCSFIAGVLLIDVDEWERTNATVRVERWMRANTAAVKKGSWVYRAGSQSPLQLEFHNSAALLPQSWQHAGFDWVVPPMTDAIGWSVTLPCAGLLHFNG
eukprot:gene45013-5158_t